MLRWISLFSRRNFFQKKHSLNKKNFFSPLLLIPFALVTDIIGLLDFIFNQLEKELNKENLSSFGSLYKGLIATGDMFISDSNKLNQLSKEIVGLSAVEMEGASFAQVAFQENVDWIVMRVISDEANSEAAQNFSEFLELYKKTLGTY